jgi:integrase
VQLALQEESEREKWSNRTFNNNVTALSTVFNFLEDEKIIPENPTKKITRKKAKAQKHRYYDPERFKKVRAVMQQQDPLLFFAAKLVYYLCIRSEKELKYLKVGNIFLDRRQVFIQAEESKTDADRFISIPDELMDELAAIRNKYPTNYYVVGKGARIKYVKENTPSSKPFPVNMLSARFMKIRKAAGLSSNHTLYSFKHTRIIHLKQDGANDADIMQLTGHESYQAFSDYLRDLGMAGNPETINNISRKF